MGMICNEFISEIQRVLTEMTDDEQSGIVLLRTHIERLRILVDAVEVGEIHPRFIDLLDEVIRSTDWSSGQIISHLKGMKAVIETQVFVETANMRNGNNADVIPFFSPSNSDRKRMLELCGELRSLTNESVFLTPEFRNLLLKRIAAMEFQINTDKGQLDTILASANDIGEAAGKFGEDVKPFTDRVLELIGLGRKTSGHYAQLPAPENTKKLPAPPKLITPPEK